MTPKGNGKNSPCAHRKLQKMALTSLQQSIVV
ncbi:U5 small nuclear ribonucleoprotein 40 kDa protein-like [Iris pallida]|uniref:U5 small nuclear ribonucleoprotein 40 kDa protein-like n=1 Tax=Iris pallida TaxID=29817 RepID=A0AAX6FZJ4_IRIPA|nr:U5 small nuclear ribonucleoprotein 40 kDa protein-like [Iris pallida]